MNSAQTHSPVASAGGQVLLPVMKVLLEGIWAHSVKGDPEEHNHLHEKFHKLLESVEEDQLPSESVLQAKAAVHAFREYSIRTTRRLRVRRTEQAAIMWALLETLGDLRIAGPDKMRELMEICGELSAETAVEQLRLAKLRLTDCLAQIRQEAERQSTAHHESAERDSITHLLGRSAAEAALAKACASETPLCAVILVVERMPLYNRRYGRDVGDKVLRFFANFVEHAFAADEVYRWTGPSVLLLRPGAFDKVTHEVRRILEPRLQYELDTSSRTVLLSIDTSCSVLRMMLDPRLLVNQIDAFVTR